VSSSGGPTSDGSELNPTGQENASQVNYYENVVTSAGPPASLAGATVINTAQLVINMRMRDGGTNPFWLVDARGCTTEPTIPTAVCVNPDTLSALEARVTDRTAQLVVFCHDGTCPMSYEMASQAVAAGYTNVYWYRGGINAWMAAGLPTVTHSTGN
jgi:rhodanese-related sulfurtransferase